MARTNICYTKICETEPYKVPDQATNDLIYKLKWVFLGNDESVMDEYDMSIEFYDYSLINFHDILELVYDEIVIKRNNLLNHVKTIADNLLVTFYTNKLKYAPDDICVHQITFDLRGHPLRADEEHTRFGREYVAYICASLADGTTILSISISPKDDEEE